MFSVEDVTKIANLSSLEVTEEEKQVFAEQFSTILDYFKVLDTLEVSTETVDHDDSHLVTTREDKAVPSTVSPEQFSPYIENHSFKVPKIINSSN